jgi:LPS sulfotransferase NodH
MNIPVTIYDEALRKSSDRVFIFSEARSGSNWLVETLNSSGDLGLLKEIMQPGQQKEFKANHPEYFEKNSADVLYMEKQLSYLDKPKRGCKILFPQAVRFMDLYEFLFSYRDARFIFLRRQNVVKGEVSGLIAGQFALWHSFEQPPKHMIEIDPEFLYKRVLWRDYTTTYCMKLIRAYCGNCFEMTYEELFTDTSRAINSLCGFLAIHPENLILGREVKSNPHSLTEMISNYDEVKTFFDDKPPFHQMFT